MRFITRGVTPLIKGRKLFKASAVRHLGISLRAIAIAAVVLCLNFISNSAFAQSGPRSINISGGLFQPNGSAITNSNVQFKIEIRDKAGLCVLYSETHASQDLSQTKGGFSLLLGSGASPANKISGTTALDANVFKNPGVVAAFTDCPSGLTLNAGDERVIRVYYDLGSGMTAMTPDVPVVSSAYAMVAETLQGKNPEDFVTVQGTTAGNLQQTNLEYAFSLTNWQRLKDLLDGVSSQYLPTAGTGAFNFGNRVITGVAAPGTTADAVNKGYADSYIGGKATDLTSVGAGFGNGQTLVWDQVQNKWVTGAATDSTKLPLAGGTMVGNINMGGYDLLNVGNIVQGLQKSHTLGRFTSVEEATLVATLGTGSIGMSWYNTDLKTYKIWDGSNAITQAYLSSVGTSPGTLNPSWFPASGVSAGTYGGATSVPVFTVGADGRLTVAYGTTIAGVAPGGAAGGDLTGSYPSPLIAPLAVTTAKLSDDAITAAKIKSTGVAINRLIATDPVTPNTLTYFECPIVDQIMTWTASGWSCTTVAALSPVKTVAGRTPDAAGNVALAAYDINGIESAATKDYGTAAGDLVELDGTGKIPSSLLPGGTGTITAVTAVAPLQGGGVSGNVTVSIDVGTGANQVVRLNGSAQIPAVDGSLLTGVNASKLGTRDVSTAGPGVNEVLGWNGSFWMPMSAAVGSVTNVISGTGLVAGSITSFGTINVDVGTTASKIVQFDASARYPANDGSLITNVNAVRLQSQLVSATAPTANQILKWNGSQWEPSTDTGTGTVTSVVSGTGLVAGTITSGGTIAVDVGTGANQVVQLNGSSQIPAVDGSLLTGVNASKIGTRAVTSAAPGVSQVLGWNGSQWEPMSAAVGSMTSVTAGAGMVPGTITSAGTVAVDVGTGANKVVQFDSSARYPANDGSLIANVNAVRLQSQLVSATAPTANQILKWNGSHWEPSTDTGTGTVTSVVSGTGLVAGTITSGGTIAVDVGTAANQVVQLNGSSQIPAVDGSLLTGVNASKIGTRAVTSAAPGVSQVLGWNGSQWEPMSAAVGSMTSVTAGAGMVPGTITSAGTVAVDVGTGANKVVQFDGSARYPANDGSLITNVNAVRLQSQLVSATAPTANQILKWNGSHWEPSTDTGTGTVTSVVSGAGLVAGTITNGGTIAVDVGTGANQVVQLNGSSQIPAVDGSLLTDVNASKIGTRPVTSAAPGVSQVLGWNGSQWEPMSAAVGSMTSVTAGAGMVPGTITSAGTVAVDVGTAANKVVQFDGSARYPANDGSLITNVNAVRLQSQLVSATAPTANQILKWNGSQWEPSTDNGTGTVTSVVSGAGLVAGTITAGGTIAVDVGTGANKIVQLNGSSQIPAVDGSLLTGVNASKIGTRDVTSAAPTPNQVLAWNGSHWEPTTAATGSVTSVVAGTGLVAGTITAAGTLNIDVGTGANKIVQLNGSSQIPAVDGSLLTGVNASTIGTRAIATTLPTTNQILTWNGSRWEPMAASSSLTWPLAANPGTAPASAPSYAFASDTDSGFYSPGAGTAAFATNGTARMTIDSVGQVGIGTASPVAMLEIAGNTRAWTYEAGQGNTSNLSYGLWGHGMYFPSGDSTAFVTNTIERMRIDAGGNVGIGTTTPGSVALDVVGTGANNSAILIPRNTTALRPAGANGMVRYNTNTNKFEFFENNAWVNYGTGSGSTSFPLLASPGTTPSTAPSYSFTGDVDTGFFSPGVGTAAFATNGVTRMTVDSSGNVGIGTNNPIHKLHIHNDVASNDAILYVQNSSNTVGTNSVLLLQTTHAAADPYIRFQASGAENFYVGVDTSDSGKFKIGSTGGAPQPGVKDALTITSAGNVGIGTTSPGSVALEIEGTGANNSAILIPRNTTALRPAGANGMLRYNTNTNKFEFFENNAWVNYGTGSGGGPNLVVAPSTESLIGGSTNASLVTTASLYNTVYGYQAMNALTSGTSNVAVGKHAATSLTSGSSNVIIGSNAGYNSNTASGNVAIGATAFSSNTSGSSNVAIGNGALNSNTTNSDSTAVGQGALQNSTGGQNTALGHTAGNSITTGTNNLALGAGVGSSTLTTGSSNILIGTSNAVTTPAAGTNNFLNIGNAIFATGMTGTVGAPAGNVGIGTTSPGSARLEIAGVSTDDSAILIPRSTTATRPAGANGMIRYNTNTNKFEFFENSAWVNYGTGSGSTSFPLLASPGTTPSTAPSYAFASDGDTGFFSPGVGTAALATNGTTRLTVDSVGNIGIGLTNPTAKLEIDNSSNTGRAISVTSSIGATANNPLMQLYTSNAAFDQVGLDVTYNGTTEAVGVYNSGSGAGLYVGQSGDNSGLHVYSNVGASSSNSLAHFHADNAAFDQNVVQIDNDGVGASFLVNDEPSDTTPFVIDSSGKVGIGTATPGSVALEIVGTGANNSALLVPRLTTALRPAGANGMIRYNTNANKFEFFENGSWVNYGTGSGGSVSFPLLASPGTTASTAPSYAFTSDGDTGFFSPGVGTAAFATNGTTRLTIDSLGNLGVGTTTAREKLEVSGNILFTDVAGAGTRTLATEDTTGSNSDSLTIKTGTSSSGSSGTLTLAAGNAPSGTAGNIILTAGDASAGTPGSIRLQTSNVERLRVSADGNIGIGTTTPGSAALDVVGTGANNSALLVPRLTTALRPAGANGMLRYNTNVNKFEFFENGSWVNYGTGSGGGVTNLDGLSDAIYNSTGQSLYVGTSAGTGQVNGNAANVALGYEALDAQNNTSSGYNTAIGFKALTSNQSGHSNTAVGSEASHNMTTVIGQTAIGAGALYTNATAVGNTAVGSWTLYSATGAGNTGMGGGVGQYISSGTYNTGVGADAMKGISGTPITGTNNAALGSAALTSIRGAASNNTALGANAGYNLTTGSGNIIIGSGIHAPTATSSNTMTIGNLIYATGLGATGTTVSTGKVGIGVANPGSTLEVNGDTELQEVTVWESLYGAGGDIYSFTIADDSNSYFAVSNHTTRVLTIPGGTSTGAGNVGIGTTTPAHPLDVVGIVRATSFITTSDGRLKRNIRPVEGIEALMKLNGVRYEWKSDGKSEIGLIAQDVEEVFPEAVVTDERGFKAVKYQNLIAPVIEATKELYGMCKDNSRELATVKEEVRQLKDENAELRNQVQDLNKRFEALEKALKAGK